jgi:hypothetical protein
MRAMLTAFVAIIAIAFGAYYALNNAGFSAAERNAAPSVRLE